MAKGDELALEALPAPGEPLTRDTHEENQQSLDEELAERIELLRGKIHPREHRRLMARYRKLWKQLNRAGYNALVSECWDARLECEALAEQFKSAKDADRPDIRARGLAVTARGRDLQAQLDRLNAKVEEFDSIGQRLATHDMVIDWEIEDAENTRAFQREARVWEQQLYSVFRQSPRLHHKGTDKRGREFVKIPKIEHVFIKDDKIYFQVQLTRQGLLLRLLGRYQSALPYGVDIQNLTQDETLENLSGACDRKVTVERGKRGETFYYVVSRLDSPDGLPRRVLFSKVIPYYPIADHEKTPWPAGVSNDRTAVFFNFEDDPHVLIAGATKGGKSNLINVIIATLVRMNTPRELRVLLIDNKGGMEFTHWAGISHALRPMIKRREDVLPALQFIRSIMNRRQAAFERMKFKNLADFNRGVRTDDRLPRILVVIDEMATLKGDAEVQQQLIDITSQGRAVGVHIILCTQHVISDIVDSSIKVNMVLRVATQMPSITASLVILDTPTAAHLPKIAGRVVFRSGSIETIAQTPFISDEEIALALSHSRKMTVPDSKEFAADAPPIQPREKFSRDDLFQLALEQFGGKLTGSGMKDIVEDMTEYKLKLMINGIIAEVGTGELEHRGQRYIIRKRGKAHLLVAVGDAVGETLSDIPEAENPADHQEDEAA